MEKAIPLQTPSGDYQIILNVWGAKHGSDTVAEYEIDRIEDAAGNPLQKEDFPDPENYYLIMNMADRKLNEPGLLENLTNEYEEHAGGMAEYQRQEARNNRYNW